MNEGGAVLTCHVRHVVSLAIHNDIFKEDSSLFKWDAIGCDHTVSLAVNRCLGESITNCVSKVVIRVQRQI